MHNVLANHIMRSSMSRTNYIMSLRGSLMNLKISLMDFGSNLSQEVSHMKGTESEWVDSPNIA